MTCPPDLKEVKWSDMTKKEKRFFFCVLIPCLCVVVLTLWFAIEFMDALIVDGGP